MSRTFLGTAIAAGTWVAVCTYLYFAWPSLVALLEILGPPTAAGHCLVRVPRPAFPAIALLAIVGLVLKDRWLRASLALAVDALIAAPAFVLIGFLVHPILVPLE